MSAQLPEANGSHAPTAGPIQNGWRLEAVMQRIALLNTQGEDAIGTLSLDGFKFEGLRLSQIDSITQDQPNTTRVQFTRPITGNKTIKGKIEESRVIGQEGEEEIAIADLEGFILSASITGYKKLKTERPPRKKQEFLPPTSAWSIIWF
jgi:hypothetical protein